MKRDSQEEKDTSTSEKLESSLLVLKTLLLKGKIRKARIQASCDKAPGETDGRKDK